MEAANMSQFTWAWSEMPGLPQCDNKYPYCNNELSYAVSFLNLAPILLANQIP